MDNQQEESRTKDVATETSYADMLGSTATFSDATLGSQSTLTTIRNPNYLNYRDAATETDFPVVTSLTISFSTGDMDDDYSSESKDREVARKRDPLPSTMKPRFMFIASSSSDDIPSDSHQREFALKASKSQHVKKYHSSEDDDDDHIPDIDSNLQKGNVFVYMVIPPDGGYGWFIMFISFLCQVVVDGIIFGIGVILPHVGREFDVPGSKVVLVASMQVGFYFLAGTVSSAFINKYGFRPVALAGCLLSIIVLTIATFSTNLVMMIFFYSILGGPGLSMVWVSSQLIIGYYFEKYRPIASGLSCSGAGVGIMMFAYMNNVLVEQVGWRNLMRIHVGFLLLVLLMGMTFVEVAPTRIGKVKDMTVEDTDSESWDLITDMTRYSRDSLKAQDHVYSLDDNFQSVLEKMDEPNPTSSKCDTVGNFCCPCVKRYLEQRREAMAQQAATKRYVIRLDLMEKQDLFYMGPTEHAANIHEHRKTLAFAEGERRRTISLDAADPKIHPRSVVTALSTVNVSHHPEVSRKSYRELKETKRCPLLAYMRPSNLIHPKIRNGFRLLFDFRLLSIKEFRLLFASAFLFPMGFNIPFVYSTVRVQIEPSFAKLISPSIGFSNFAFRIASGFVAFKFREHTTIICGAGMAFGGLAVFVSAFYGLDVVWFQFAYAICYGIAPAFYSTLRAIIYVRSLGLDKLTNAFGLTALAMGMGVFIGTTAGGILNDLTGDYTASFAFAGVCIIVAGILKLLLPYLTPATQKIAEKK